ncbi:MAG: 3-dehydroquinate synthase [Verrucomicrobiota bacterium]
MKPDSLTVALAERSYPIHFAADASGAIRSEIDALRAAGRKVAVVTDRNLAATQASALAMLAGEAPVLTLEPGEQTKSLGELGRILDFLAGQRLDRSSVLVAVGGGVIGDLAGFAAASYLRGIDFIQVPTTLLAMVDSSVGGKTGINLKAGKNLVGAFHQPNAVYIGTDLLKTLPPREFAAGMAEVIKYGLLGDAALLAELVRAPLTVDDPRLAGVIRRCCEIKAGIVAADERETAKDGGRALLNLGHTFGHAIEQVTGYGAYLHGEAVAVGLCAAARLSQKLGYIDAAAVARVDAVVSAHGLPVRLREPLPLEPLLAAMSRDKKVRAGVLRFVVMTALGTSITQGGIDAELAAGSFREVGAAG